MRAVLAGLPAAVVTLAWAASRPLPMIDDWGFIRHARADTGFYWSSRPGEALLHWAVFRLSDTHPVPPLLVLAVLNVAAGTLLWLFAERRWGSRVATLSALAWAVLPNRGSTRMWASCIPNLAAGVLVLAALVVADRDTPTRHRVAAVVGFAAAACLTYEGVDALAAAAVVLVAWRQPDWAARARVAGTGGAVLLGAAAWSITHTQKTGTVHLGANASRLVSTQFGVGLWPAKLVVLGVVMFATVATAALVPILGRRRVAEEQALLWGAGGMLLGAAVFLATGFPLADAGLLDRANVYTDLGTSLVIGAALALAWRCHRVAGAACATLALAALSSGNVTAVDAYVRSARDARAVLVDVRSLPQYPAGPIVMGPLPDYDGVAGFTSFYDITDAIAVRYGLAHGPFARVTVTDAQAAALAGSEPVYRYCPNSRTLIAWQQRC